MAETQPVVPVTPVAPVVDDSESLADHEAQFGPGAVRTPATDDDEPDDLPNLRAKSQQAKSSDYDEIAAHTKRLREAETQLGLKLDRKPGESQRVYTLRRQADIAEALRDAKKVVPGASSTVLGPIPAKVKPAETPAVAEWTEKEPKAEDFALDDDPYGAFLLARGRYERKKERFEESQAQAKTAVEAAQREAVARDEEISKTHVARVSEYVKAKPDFWQVVGQVEDLGEIPHLLVQGIMRSDNGPELMYYLGSHPDDLADLILMTRGQAVEDQAVAVLQRRLARLPTRDTNAEPSGSTGALPPAAPTRVIPRPPTPVRTGSIKTDTSDLPDDDSDLSAHEKAFGPKSRFARSRR